MDIKQLTKHLENVSEQPPFDQWNPPYCGEIDMEIKSDGTWFHLGSEIKRVAMKKLFASVLITENNQYFLKTPAEKVKIKVETLPFVITQWSLQKENGVDCIVANTNLDHQIVLGPNHPLVIDEITQLPIVEVIRGLYASIHRNVFYQWAEIAKETVINGKPHFVISSANQTFSLGSLE